MVNEQQKHTSTTHTPEKSWVSLFETEEVHISEITVGDTVIEDGEAMTVGKESFNRCPFMGLSLFGDTYLLGRRLVTRLVTCEDGKLVRLTQPTG